MAVPCRLPSQRASYGAEPTTRQYPREVRSNDEGLSRQGRCGFAPFSAVDRGGICGARWNCPTSSSSAVFDGHSSAGGVTDTSAHLSQRIRFTAFARGEIATGEVHRLVDRALDGAAPELAAVHMCPSGLSPRGGTTPTTTKWTIYDSARSQSVERDLRKVVADLRWDFSDVPQQHRGTIECGLFVLAFAALTVPALPRHRLRVNQNAVPRRSSAKLSMEE